MAFPRYKATLSAIIIRYYIRQLWLNVNNFDTENVNDHYEILANFVGKFIIIILERQSNEQTKCDAHSSCNISHV